jgi:hypothetical protein
MAAVRTRVYLVVIGGYALVRLVGFAVLAILADHYDRPVFDLMKAWDGDWYLSIAEYGYDNVPARLTDANGHHTRFGPLAFYPLVPWLIRSVATTGVGPLAAGMIVSLVAGCVAACGPSGSRGWSTRGPAPATCSWCCGPACRWRSRCR